MFFLQIWKGTILTVSGKMKTLNGIRACQGRRLLDTRSKEDLGKTFVRVLYAWS